MSADDETTEGSVIAMSETEYPYLHDKVPVMNSMDELVEFMKKYPDFSFCPYLAYKDEESWGKSTSRVYMNQALPHFLYVPINVPKEDSATVRKLFEEAKDNPAIVAINITQPHKSNAVAKELFAGDPNADVNIDTLIRDSEDNLVPFDLNAPAFVSWFEEDVEPLAGKRVILVGVGGAGEPIAKRIMTRHPKELVLVDPTDKTKLAQDLASQGQVSYRGSIDEDLVGQPSGDLVVINAAGKEGAAESSDLDKLLEKDANQNAVFVDIRPQLDIDIVERAKALGWKSYTGNGMNARNDYALVTGIAEAMNVTPPPFDAFEELVAKAS